MEEKKAEHVLKAMKGNLALGVQQGRVYAQEGTGWIPIMDNELPVMIRRLFKEGERETISSACIKEAIERLIQDPDSQLHFTDEKVDRYINVRNGVFDAYDKKLVEDDTDFKFSYTMDFSYIEAQERAIPMFEKFVHDVFPNECEKKKTLLLQILGYCISDFCLAKTGFFFIGESNSGKSTMLELLQRVLPRQSVTAIPLYRLDNKFNLARLADSRVNISSEISEKSFRASDIYKMFTANEIVTAEHKGKKPFEFRMKCKSINAGNMLPDFDSIDGMDALINRMTILLFPFSIPKEKQDLKLLDKLWDERDSIFSHALDALNELYLADFTFVEPEDTARLKKQMYSTSHIFDEFVHRNCEKGDDKKEHFVTLYDAFKEFCEENLVDAKLSKTQFSQKFTKMQGIRRAKFRIGGSKALYGAIGISLKRNAGYDEDPQEIEDPSPAS